MKAGNKKVLDEKESVFSLARKECERLKARGVTRSPEEIVCDRANGRR
jgi:hypothetical protein